ncbi:MAG: hypothetical protein Q7S04_03945 [Candidatus Moranbacteria bacterium]|nr:hypothetical protein [Candidatus Moranbacteria bacterium]
MKTIAIIGVGVVGSAFAEFFECKHKVLRVDLDTELTLEDAARVADVVFIVTLPIEGVATLFARAVSVMRPGTLLIHGTSIENPTAPHHIDTTLAIEKGITACHCHLHFKPEIPLARTLFGQNVSISIVGKNEKIWGDWLEHEFMPFQPLLHHLKPGEHDNITVVSQLVHTIVTAVIGAAWQKIPSQIVTKGIGIGGPPCRFLIRSIFRTASAGKVMSSILFNHPLALAFIEHVEEALQELKNLIRKKDEASLETMLGAARKIFDQKKLAAWDESTSRLIRLEADMQKTVAAFRFPAEKNISGLLEKILHEFGKRGIDMTSTIAQVTPDGGCIIMIGVKENSPAVQEAETEIRKWM